MRRRVRDAETAADLTMEVFAAALLSLNRKDAEPPRDLVAWLFGIAHHKLADHLRRRTLEDRARRQLGMERIQITDADIERIDALTDEAHVLALLNRLPPEQQ